MYNIGDKIVYSIHGAGTIEDIQEIEILGNTEMFYILRFPINDITISVPVTESEKIRPVITKEEGKAVMEILRSDVTEMSQNWGKRFRDNLEHIKTGNIFEIADIVRNLSILSQKKGLSASENKMLINAKRVMVSELVIVGSMTKEEAMAMIDDAITLEQENI
ncbi:CarD family transcriptional regulator [Helcococcus ovis]|uniref:CarD family transcriptional regulator n=2 Tax=Helcococcus ovis TaxID=72026 RepID=A0A4R9C2Z3_9FIRM|nr:CarD family transcriptional regulator [Helcococcus ovis]TFF65495.1 CarD family transcriptional regulator [Helcococcus ovis]TFF65733.1 CarD family transcriptional regulator [Helcococcus ovis]TFF68499.1 CarD family transcriptional regulator [Helcococcus ovis]WNZ01443.1 CarD family transcriptional regulator [Helcococcus ovis]